MTDPGAAVVRPRVAGAVLALGRRAIVDLPTAAFGAASLAMLLGRRRTSEPVVLLAAAVAGIAVRYAAGR
jgi:hypothetical protein